MDLAGGGTLPPSPPRKPKYPSLSFADVTTTQAVTRYSGWEGYEYRPQNLLEDALKDDPLHEETQEEWEDTYQVWWDGSPRPVVQDSGMDVVYLEALLSPRTPTTH